MNNSVTFDGYLAELITLYAERAGKTPEVYVIEFFSHKGCNAPNAKNFSSPEVQCT